MLDIGFLAGIDLFKHLPDSCLETLEKDSNLLDCSAGHLFFQPEQTGRVLFVLETGSVRTFRTYGGRKLTITVLKPPAIFGVMGCFGQAKYLSSAEALEASRVRMISRDSIQALLECAPHVTHKLIDLMSEVRGLDVHGRAHSRALETAWRAARTAPSRGPAPSAAQTAQPPLGHAEA